MNCYFRVDNGPWKKAAVSQGMGGRYVAVRELLKNGMVPLNEEILLWDPEILFQSAEIRVTGYRKRKQEKSENRIDLYEMVGVSLRFTKPRS